MEFAGKFLGARIMYLVCWTEILSSFLLSLSFQFCVISVHKTIQCSSFDNITFQQANEVPCFRFISVEFEITSLLLARFIFCFSEEHNALYKPIQCRLPPQNKYFAWKLDGSNYHAVCVCLFVYVVFQLCWFTGKSMNSNKVISSNWSMVLVNPMLCSVEYLANMVRAKCETNSH